MVETRRDHEGRARTTGYSAGIRYERVQRTVRGNGSNRVGRSPGVGSRDPHPRRSQARPGTDVPNRARARAGIARVPQKEPEQTIHPRKR